MKLRHLLLLLVAIAIPGYAEAMTRASAPAKFSIPFANSAGSSYITYPTPTPSQIPFTNCAASLTDGFPPKSMQAVSAGGCAPFGQDFNGILKQITQWNQQTQAGAAPAYDSGFSASISGYPEGSILSQASSPYCFWISQIDNNTSDPDTGGSNWTGSCPGGGVGGTSTGSANSQVITATPYSLVAYAKVCWIAGYTNTGPLQINVNSGGLTNVYARTQSGLASLVGGEVHVGMVSCATWDTTQYELDTVAAAPIAVQPPQGYLTPCNYANSPSVTGCTVNQMLPTADVTAAATVYYGTWFGSTIPVYNGSVFQLASFSELSLTLPSSFTSGSIRDACVFLNSGTPTLVGSVAWNNSTPGSGARGTGGGSAQIALLNGIWTNAVAITGTNGASTYSIPANQCTIVGSLLFSANGQVTWNVIYGQSRQVDVANMYNQQPLTMIEGDPAANWTDTNTSTFGYAHASSANSIEILLTRPNKVAARLQMNSNGAIGTNVSIQSGVGLDATTTCGVNGQVGETGAGVGVIGTAPASCLFYGTIGAHNINALTHAVGSGQNWAGQQSYMQLSVEMSQ